jgi:hypothetical protein
VQYAPRLLHSALNATLQKKGGLSEVTDSNADQPMPVMSKRSPGEVSIVFLKLGLTSFGGPIAHIGYFRNELVVRRRWLSESSYGDLVALCQFLPGPASSQVGFSLGVLRGGGILGGWRHGLLLPFLRPSSWLLLRFGHHLCPVPLRKAFCMALNSLLSPWLPKQFEA